MSNTTDTVVVQRGLKCPHCGTIGEVGDAACVSGDFDFPDNFPVVGVNAAGEVVESDGQPVSPSASASKAPPAVTSNVVATPVVASPAVVPAATSSAPTGMSDGVLVAVCPQPMPRKACWLEVRVDVSPRDGRPPEGDADFDAAPTWSPIRFDLAAPVVRFGRFPILGGSLTIDGDRAVSKFQGDLLRLDSGSYKVQHNADANGIFFPAQLDADGTVKRAPFYLEEGHEYILSPGDRFQMGDWIECEYFEQTV